MNVTYLYLQNGRGEMITIVEKDFRGFLVQDDKEWAECQGSEMLQQLYAQMMGWA